MVKPEPIEGVPEESNPRPDTTRQLPCEGVIEPGWMEVDPDPAEFTASRSSGSALTPEKASTQRPGKV